jgi:alcohol dehydrogenase class IV
VAGDLFSEISRAIGYSGEVPSKAADYLTQRVRQVQKQLDMPGSYQEAGLNESTYEKKIKEFSLTSGTYPTTLTNPRKPTIEELESLYRACYRGDFSLIE